MPEQHDATAVAGRVRDGDHVVLDTSRPRGVGRALAARDDLQDVTVTAYGFPYDDPAPLDALADAPGVTVRVSMAGPGLRDLVAAGEIEFVPRTFLAAARAPVRPSDDRRVVALLGSPPAGEAQPLGPLSAYGEALVAAADVVVVERTPALPVLDGGRTVPVGAVDHAVEAAGPPPTLPSVTPTGAERETAANVVAALPDRPTVQLGVGSVPTELGRRLAEAGDPLTIHSGLLGESVRPVVAAGVAGTVRGCMAVGEDPSFYDWLADAPVELRPASVTHDPGHLATLDRFVAVNGALSVDRRGQVAAETIDGRQVSGVGGQSAFMAAASQAPDGRAVIAMTARAGTTPKIVPSLDGEVVTTPRHFVDEVVTEFGRARLGDRSAGERAAALARVAHPEDRPALRESARS
ncbi:acetyl-CoA hydrolase/transferase C-terminal domain-containing protein [Haloglomus litoreum]|uniref:acetyl-CoA hydrolase/transferase C-terminal domain-containing protein n=1 Tax=Haloglomus litoreum TaxID=3034026 RepID=UPI0023E85318|nr:acetyl-CoA hydrolase/transferase C-terminal domain-containing protein [Haloglomus sp. DT116]